MELPSMKFVPIRNRIAYYKNQLNASVESMEGAALHYVALQEKIPFLQMRSLSNFVGERDKTKWVMDVAIANLNIELIENSYKIFEQMKLTEPGFSPCPNDTFIFDALVNKKIDTEGLEFDVVLEDIQTLNEWSNEGKLDITKLSFPAFFRNKDKYEMLNSGAALGKGVGPLLVAKRMVNVPDIVNSSIAIPGEHTTANFLLSFAFPMAKNKHGSLFRN